MSERALNSRTGPGTGASGEAGTSPEVAIVVNGRPVKTVARSLAELVAAQNLSEQKIATALNGHFVAATERATTALAAGDRVEIVSPRQGG